jgi:cell wall-associated NlpC family hydrolase
MNQILKLAASRRFGSTFLSYWFPALLVSLFLNGAKAQANANDLQQLELKQPIDDVQSPIGTWRDHQIATRYFALQRLQKAALEATAAVHVPYVWGGNQIGSLESCLACNQCLEEKRPGPKQRIRQCPSCAQCGIDCSHLVNQIFAAAGLDLPYAASNVLAGTPASVLFRNYRLIDLGKNYAAARPGDIIVYRRHVGLLMANHGGEKGDLIHASRFRRKGGPAAGGIRYDINRNIVHPRGGLVRILRHEKLEIPGRVPLS